VNEHASSSLEFELTAHYNRTRAPSANRFVNVRAIIPRDFQLVMIAALRLNNVSEAQAHA